MPNNTSQHILTTSANLLGFCLFVTTALHITDRSARTLVDEFTGVISILLAASCVLSFLSIRSQKLSLKKKLESVADYFFLASLLGILVVIVITVFNIFHLS